jgi:hypothetical protein
MSKLFCVTITLAGLLAFSFAAFAKEQNCEQKRVEKRSGKGNPCITNCMQPCDQTDPGKHTEMPGSFSDPRGIKL